MSAYPQRILERYKTPLHRRTLEDATHEGHAVNPLCGDEITVRLRVQDGKIQEAVFDGVGCAVSQAAADLLVEHWAQRSKEEAEALTLAQVVELLGSPVPPARERCAVLPVEALRKAERA